MSIVSRVGQRVAGAFGLRVQRDAGRPNQLAHLPAWAYQEPLVRDRIKAGDVVIDVGSGNYPSPRADLCADFFPDETFHRSGKIVETKPVVVCSVERMPFKGHAIDFAICSHVLEHVPSPARAAAELVRVAAGGYVETPAYGKDILVGSGHMHRWQVVEFEGTLHFFEYSPRQSEAHVSSPMMDLWLSPRHHPWQDFFWQRQDLFNAWVIWKGAIAVVEYRRGSQVTPLAPWRPVDAGTLPARLSALTEPEIGLLERCLATPDGAEPMRFSGNAFANASGSVVFPVRGKRVYCEVGSHST